MIALGKTRRSPSDQPQLVIDCPQQFVPVAHRSEIVFFERSLLTQPLQCRTRGTIITFVGNFVSQLQITSRKVNVEHASCGILDVSPRPATAISLLVLEPIADAFCFGA